MSKPESIDALATLTREPRASHVGECSRAETVRLPLPRRFRSTVERFALILILALASLLALRGVGDSSLGYSDADRMLMDGVYVRDFLCDLPITRIWDYTIEYYGQYPALSIGYKPPFFAGVEGVFNLVFGVHQWSSRLALLCFLLVGMASWFKLVERIADRRTAIWSSLLLVTTPFFIQWGWYTVTEIPVVSLSLLSAYFFYRYTEDERSRHLFFSALAYCAAIWTKQPAALIGLWYVLYALSTRKFVHYLKRREVWGAVALIVLLVTPLAVITLNLGKLNVYQSVGAGVSDDPYWRVSWDNLTTHFGTLYHEHLTLPALVLSVAGIAIAAVRRDRRALYLSLLILSTYAFFTYMVGKNARYPIFWIPAFCFFAALLPRYLGGNRRVQSVAGVVLLAVVVFQIVKVYERKPLYATGYDEAAQYVLDNSTSPTVFFDGYNDGYFTYFLRMQDDDRSMLVLRGDKLLTSFAITPDTMDSLEVHAHTEEDIRKILDDYGVHLLVVESRDWSGVPIHGLLRTMLHGDSFRLEKEIPIDSNRPPLAGQELLVYRYLQARPLTADTLKLRLPVVGRTLEIPIRKLVER